MAIQTLSAAAAIPEQSQSERKEAYMQAIAILMPQPNEALVKKLAHYCAQSPHKPCNAEDFLELLQKVANTFKNTNQHVLLIDPINQLHTLLSQPFSWGKYSKHITTIQPVAARVLNGFNINTPRTKQTPLHVLVSFASPLTQSASDAIKYILSHNSAAVLDTNAIRTKFTPLQAAAANNQFQVLPLLLDKITQDPDFANIINVAYQDAKRNLATETMSILRFMQLLSDPAVRQEVLPQLAAEEMQRMIVFSGAEPTDRNYPIGNNGNSLLLEAIRAKNAGVVQTLLMHKGVNPNRSNRNGNTALHVAVQSDDLKIVQLLLNDPRCDHNIKNKAGKTALELAQDPAIGAAIRNRPRTLHAKGATELTLAIKTGNIQEAMHLLAQGADPNTAPFKALADNEKAGNTPLMYAAARQDLNLVQNLLDHGANPKMPNNAGDTPLHFAMAYGQPQTMAAIVEALIGAGANIGAPNIHVIPPMLLSMDSDSAVQHIIRENGWQVISDPVQRAYLPLLLSSELKKVVRAEMEEILADARFNNFEPEKAQILKLMDQAIDNTSYHKLATATHMYNKSAQYIRLTPELAELDASTVGAKTDRIALIEFLVRPIMQWCAQNAQPDIKRFVDVLYRTLPSQGEFYTVVAPAEA
jgi:ankyrin repeat protein